MTIQTPAAAREQLQAWGVKHARRNSPKGNPFAGRQTPGWTLDGRQSTEDEARALDALIEFPGVFHYPDWRA